MKLEGILYSPVLVFEVFPLGGPFHLPSSAGLLTSVKTKSRLGCVASVLHCSIFFSSLKVPLMAAEGCCEASVFSVLRALELLEVGQALWGSCSALPKAGLPSCAGVGRAVTCLCCVLNSPEKGDYTDTG